MYVQTSLWRDLEDRPGQNLSKSHHHQSFGLQTAQVAHNLRMVDLDRLINGEACLLGDVLDGGLTKLLSASCWAIRLGHYRRHLMPHLEQAAQRRRGERRRPQEN